MNTDVLIVGAGVGGCAAALALTSLGLKVIMTEPTDWIGGQFTSQAVPPDENPWIEGFGCTRRYRHYRNSVRQYYKDHYPLVPEQRLNPRLNPGQGRVSRVGHEPRVSLAVLEQMLGPARQTGRIRTLLYTIPVAAEVDGDKVKSVTVENTQTGKRTTISAKYVLDASELGDLLPLTGTEFVTGSEGKATYNELHAKEGPDRPDNVQALTWCFALGYDPAGNYVIDKPWMYDFWKTNVPVMSPPWPGSRLSWFSSSVREGNEPVKMALFPDEIAPSGALWSCWDFRRIVCKTHYPPGTLPSDITLVNWPQVDYHKRNLIGATRQEQAEIYEEAKQLSLSYLYWLQTEAPRHDGSVGYPGLYLCPEIMGTEDGLAKAPYIRESRRIKARFTVTEVHVGYEQNGKQMITISFPDSVGIGFYGIDLHPSTAGDNYIDTSGLPHNIPLGSLLPIRMKNLLPACKNIGTTHITNGCYRLHPIEWNIGESAGLLAGFCIGKGITPHAVGDSPELLKEFQALLVAQGIEISWPRVP